MSSLINRKKNPTVQLVVWTFQYYGQFINEQYLRNFLKTKFFLNTIVQAV